MQKYKKQAFTLVELIVVITILAILGTIAFINLSGYSSGARDSKRVSDINNIIKKIGIEEIKGEVVTNFISDQATNAVTINSIATNAIQGIPNFTKLKEDGNSFKDPATSGNYVLSYAKGGTSTGAYKFTQISTINEETNSAVVKGNYYMMQTGDSPSIVKNSAGDFVVDNGIELPYSLNQTQGGGSIASRYPGCNTDDITLGSYTVSACNLGATTASTDWNISGGDYFQWGRNKGFSYTSTNVEYSPLIDGTIGLTASTDTYGFILNENFTWANTDVSNNWGSVTDTPFGTNISARQGPCASGYHVPSKSEWIGICDYVKGSSCINGEINPTLLSDIQNNLLLPFSGRRATWDGSYSYEGTRGRYWSSTSIDSNNNSELFYFYSGGIYYDYAGGTAIGYGYSVRCFKN